LKGSQFLKGILRSIKPTLAGNRGAVAVKACAAGLVVVCVALAVHAQSGTRTIAQNTVMSPY